MRYVMKEQKLKCLACGAEVRVVRWLHHDMPRCEQCEGEMCEEHLLNFKPGGVVPDEIPGGLVMEHITPGHKVYSRSELLAHVAKYNRAHGTDWMLSDGGWACPGDVEFTRWSSVSPQGLKNAEELVKRM